MAWNIIGLAIDVAMAIGIIYALRILKRIEKMDEADTAAVNKESADRDNIQRS